MGLIDGLHNVPERFKPCCSSLAPLPTNNNNIDLIEENFNLPPSPEFFLSDFQIGFMNAAQSVFPKASIFGCLFHFGQMVWRRMQKAGLQGELSQRK